MLGREERGFMKSMEDKKPNKVYCSDCSVVLWIGFGFPPSNIFNTHFCSEKSERMRREITKGTEDE